MLQNYSELFGVVRNCWEICPNERSDDERERSERIRINGHFNTGGTAFTQLFYNLNYDHDALSL